ncbi:pyridoxamine 5'-phosphate oxidase family protein [Robiginitalea sp. M366]|uniref:pyridoxamine 5'-phosphate oxidase family protein n=1 Tax=Robiginitalea aestuariiviva TaxID=3036903 RepID=UPI00240DA4E6|nr:pyridoxamine 5'-phosphate oxidase family protein [Robiginitalea aestuariiviva]MDG1572659.1 pyridoxamine 5'-phosphate oxidase family protein [Robiginitalea aestuariiviva]
MVPPENKNVRLGKEMSKNEMRQLLRSHCFGALAYLAHGHPFCVPVTYYYDPDSDSLISYSLEGHKVESMRDRPQVAFLVYEEQTPVNWRSVQLHGRYEEIRQIDAKACLHRFTKGVQEVLRQREGTEARALPDFAVVSDQKAVPVIYRIQIEEWSGRFQDG